MRTIWSRYIILETAKTAALFLCCFYMLYVMIDYAHHTASFHQYQNRFSWQLFLLYYGSEFAIRGELLLPVAVLLGSLRTLCKIKQEHELMAMLASGVKLKTLLRPFLWVGLIATALLYINAEYILPNASKQLQYIEDLNSLNKQGDTSQPIQKLFLPDGSQLIFRKYDSARNLFLDLFWIRSADEIIKMSSLNPSIHPVRGEDVVFLQRDASHKLIISKQQPHAELPELLLNETQLSETISQPEVMSLGELWLRIPKQFKIDSEKEAKLVATFCRKIVFPWICFLIILAIVPSFVHFSRQFAPFTIYAVAIFSLIVLTICIDTAQILAKRQLVNPLIALFAPICLCYLIAYFRYRRAVRA